MANSSELTRTERIAALKVLRRQIDELLKDEDGALKDDLLGIYAETGADRISLRVGSSEVGKATVVAAKETAEVVPGREDEAMDFLRGLGLTCLQPVDDWRGAFVNVGGRAVHAETGETCDALEYRPTKAPYVRYSGLKPEDVRQAFQARGIGAADVLLLMEGGANGRD